MSPFGSKTKALPSPSPMTRRRPARSAKLDGMDPLGRGASGGGRARVGAGVATGTAPDGRPVPAGGFAVLLQARSADNVTPSDHRAVRVIRAFWLLPRSAGGDHRAP